MGMSIGSSTGASATQSTAIAQWQQNQQNYKALTSAVQSGNMTAAQTAYTALTANQTPPANSPLAQLGQAIANGSASGAQQALQNLQAARGGHHAHHHHGGGQTNTASISGTSTTPDTTTSGSAGGTVGSLLNISA